MRDKCTREKEGHNKWWQCKERWIGGGTIRWEMVA
jgi:hypothetical protein